MHLYHGCRSEGKQDFTNPQKDLVVLDLVSPAIAESDVTLNPPCTMKSYLLGLPLGFAVSLALGAAAAAQTTVIAYQVPAGTTGNQNFGGAVGMDFDVANAVVVTKLGCFDPSSDGLTRLISVRLYRSRHSRGHGLGRFRSGRPGHPRG